ncbi:unnamed protein product [Sphagnum jensenii]|uniref:Uncharacterized protein n=1 Tax=Sphagnum jensenii TaxID=128206 RepID=A0ABP0X1C2_9BRYO
MVQMKINSESEDLQISRLNEFFLVADRIRKARRDARQGLGKFKCNKSNPSDGGGTRASSLTSNEISSIANGSSDPPAQGSCEAPSVPSTFLSGSSLNKGGKNASQALADPATLSDPARCWLLGKDAQANSPWSDGGSREGCLQRSSLPTSHRDILTRITMSAAKASGSFSLTQVYPKNTSPLPHIPELFSAIVGQGSGSENLGAAATRQVAREDLSTARAKEPNERSAVRRKLTTPTTAPPNPTLITHPSSGSGTTSPTRGGHPRSIAGGLQFGIRGGVPNGDGARNARKRNQKNAQNSNRTYSTRESDLQSSIRMFEATPPGVIHLRHTPYARLLPDPLRERRRRHIN